MAPHGSEAFAMLFRQKFDELSASGTAPNEAAASALAFAASTEVPPLVSATADGMEEEEPVAHAAEAKGGIIDPTELKSLVDAKNPAALELTVRRLFEDPAILSSSFSRASCAAPSASMDEDAKEHTPPPLLGGVLASEALAAAYAEIERCGADEVHTAVAEASSKALEALSAIVAGNRAGSLEVPLRAFLVLLLNPALVQSVAPEAQALFGRVCAFAAGLPLAGRTLLSAWLAVECGAAQFGAWLQALQQFITISIYQADSYEPAQLQSVTDGVKFLSLLHAANQEAVAASGSASSSGATLAPFDEFYNDAINEELFQFDADRTFIRGEYRRWRSDLASARARSGGGGAAEEASGGASLPTSFIGYPFVLEPATKAKLLQMDAKHQMQQGMQAALFQAMLRGEMQLMPYLILRIRRSNIVEDTMRILAHLPNAELKKPLKVVFEGEEGIDEGGPAKEFFQVVTRELLDPQFSMFKADEESRLLFFNPHTFEIGLEFELAGTLIGVAIFNSIILDIPFPMVVYKKLKGERPTLEDLSELDPLLASNLAKMRDFSGDVEATFGAVFQVSFEVYGGVQTFDLVPGGGDVAVTNANVSGYVDQYVQWVLGASVAGPFESFRKGFNRVCGGEALEMFRPSELELLVCGNPILDFEALESVTRYDDGFAATSPAVRHFWKAVHALDEAEKRLLLKFATGSDRAPINGLANITFVISRAGPDSDQLPTSHTCFNHLLLPDYASLEKTEAKLKCAIYQSEGFGLR